MSRLICGFIVLFGIAFAAPTAQQKPDFTGTWVAVSPAEAAGQEQVVRHTATTLSTGHASEGDGHNATYRLDGSESRNELGSHGQTIVTISKAVWEGDKIVITSMTTYPKGEQMDSKQIWSMDAEGRIVIEHTETMSGQPTRAMTITFTKKRK